jgi:hypothetical protein
VYCFGSSEAGGGTVQTRLRRASGCTKPTAEKRQVLFRWCAGVMACRLQHTAFCKLSYGGEGERYM